MNGFQGFEEVNRRFKDLMQRVRGNQSEVVVTKCLIAAGGYAAAMTPIDTSNLLNSQYRNVQVSANEVTGEIGYTAHYAAAVHNAPGTLKGQPRADFGKTGNRSEFGPRQVIGFGGGTGVGNYWDPDAEPKFLEKGVRMMVDNDLWRIVRGGYSV